MTDDDCVDVGSGESGFPPPLTAYSTTPMGIKKLRAASKQDKGQRVVMSSVFGHAEKLMAAAKQGTHQGSNTTTIF